MSLVPGSRIGPHEIRGTLDGLQFITMELIEGRTLDQLIAQTGLSLAQFFNVSVAIAEALFAALLRRIWLISLPPCQSR
jgi:hypothetical protein